MQSADGVSRDGSPVAIYLALPAGDAPIIIHDAIAPRSSILELGSGPGRLTRVLLALGHVVVAVDESSEMLEHVTGAETVCSDLFDLQLGRRFDVVLVASNLVNRPRHERRQLLDVCRRHVAVGGSVLIERFAPGWVPTAERTTGEVGPVRITFDPGERRGLSRAATVTYELSHLVWQQHFDAEDVDDQALADDCEAVGLRVVEVLDDNRTWVRLTTVEIPAVDYSRIARIVE